MLNSELEEPGTLAEQRRLGREAVHDQDSEEIPCGRWCALCAGVDNSAAFESVQGMSFYWTPSRDARDVSKRSISFHLPSDRFSLSGGMHFRAAGGGEGRADSNPTVSTSLDALSK